MKRHLWFALLPIFTMFFLGCSELKSYYDITRDERVANDYYLTLNKWTRDKTAYSEFVTKARIATTYKSRDFMDAYQKEYARLNALTEQEKNRSMDIQKELASDFTEFYFYAYIPDKDSNDFSKSNSIWKVYLIDGNGNRMEPLEIRQIEKITPVIEEFFPYVNRYYGKFYTLRFAPLKDQPAEKGKCTIVFTSVIAKIELKW